MKVSLNLAQHHSNVDLKSIPRELLLTRIGAQLGAVEEVIDWAPKYEGVIVAKIVEYDKHKDADKLSICLIDDGGVVKGVVRNDKGLVQVICGAPNAKAGLLVPWIPPGVVVPSTYGTDAPFELEVREIRGKVSNGMLGSPKELGLSDGHAGILEIDEDVRPGTPFVQLYGLDDFVIDCENKMFTHRPDCFGNLGIARELAGISGLKFASPKWYKEPVKLKLEGKLAFASKNEIADLVPRFMAQVVEDVEVRSSPMWLQAGLTRVGIRPISNIVDWTNYFMHLTAQPTHAFDYDKIKKLCSGEPTIFPRLAKKGEKLALLNGKTIELSAEDIVISTDHQAVALAGVMGGAETEVDDSTKNIIIEAATFDMYAVRRTAMRHGLFTDAVTRFNKGQSPYQNDKVLAKLIADICQQTGSKPGKLFDSAKAKKLAINKTITLRPSFINLRLGSDLDTKQVKDLLENVELDVDVQGESLHITPPFWRMDVELSEDVVEEVGRLHGFDKLPVALPKKTTRPAQRDKLFDTKRTIREILSASGANEVLTYSFVHNDLLKKVGQDPKEAYQLRNALSPDLQAYRLTLTPSLLAHIHPNIKAGYEEFAIFEMNKTHVRMHGVTDENVPEELNMVALAYAASDKTAKQKDSASYYSARKYLDNLVEKLGFWLIYESLKEDPPYQVCRPFDWQRSALVKDGRTGTFIGQIGEYTTTTAKNLKLPKHSAGFEVSLEALAECSRQSSYRAASKFPSSTQDITLEVSTSTPYEPLTNAVMDTFVAKGENFGYEISLVPVDIYSKDIGDKKRVTYRLTLSHPDKTLTTEEVNKVLDRVAAEAKKAFDASRI